MEDLQELNKELADGIMEEKAGADDEAEEVPWPWRGAMTWRQCA